MPRPSIFALHKESAFGSVEVSSFLSSMANCCCTKFAYFPPLFFSSSLCFPCSMTFPASICDLGKDQVLQPIWFNVCHPWLKNGAFHGPICWTHNRLVNCSPPRLHDEDQISIHLRDSRVAGGSRVDLTDHNRIIPDFFDFFHWLIAMGSNYLQFSSILHTFHQRTVRIDLLNQLFQVVSALAELGTMVDRRWAMAMTVLPFISFSKAFWTLQMFKEMVTTGEKMASVIIFL